MSESSDDSALCLAKPPALKRRSCDTCWRYKEKCTWSRNDIEECDRCRQIPRKCTNTRPVQRLGRKPRYSAKAVTIPASKIPPTLRPFGDMFQGLTPYEEAVVSRLADVNFFNDLMTVPRMGRAMHQQGMLSMLHHWDQTRDGCFAMFGAFATAKAVDIPGYDHDENLQRGTRALKSFRTMKCPTTSRDVLPWLWLGISVLIHAHCGLGNSGTAVRRYLLYHLKQLGQQGKEDTTHPSVVSLIAIDIYECLLFRRLPVMNVPDSEDVGADTFLGLCAPLIRLSYQLAQLSYEWGDNIVDEDALADFERSVESWQPQFPLKWSQDLSTVEATHVLTQIRVHKSMMLLFSHRLRYPFGSKDAAASGLAHSVFSELDMATCATGQPPMWTMTPFLVAALEITDMKERADIIRNIPVYGDKVSIKSQQLAAGFLAAFWRYRDDNFGFRWIDKMDTFPSLCVYA